MKLQNRRFVVEAADAICPVVALIDVKNAMRSLRT